MFEVEGGRTVRKLARYKQFVAVNEAMLRIRTARKPGARGGIVWHTQGSGKSLTMLWLALKLRRDESQRQPAIVIVTDRTKLDRQIAGVFTACGFPNPERRTSVRELAADPGTPDRQDGDDHDPEVPGDRRCRRRWPCRGTSGGPPGAGGCRRALVEALDGLRRNGRRAIRCRLPPNAVEALDAPPQDRRRDIRRCPRRPTSSSPLVDEAHRTQYRSLAANMRRALPNACFLGFTGTPIDKQDRSTLRTFGPYIDTYTIEQAVRDGATVPIFYEGRLPELRIIGQTIDQVFDRVFADRSDEERAAIRQRYATEQAIRRRPAPHRGDLPGPSSTTSPGSSSPNRFKAQVVAASRHDAVTFKETLDRLNAPESAVIMSAGHNDEERLARRHLAREQQDRLIERFKDRGDPLSILVVCDMLLTGFDAPVEQVMYLDAPLREHGLLQAIARVNRPCGEEKTYGLVVDYRGVSAKLQEALRGVLDRGRPEGADAERGRAAALGEPARGGDAVLPAAGHRPASHRPAGRRHERPGTPACGCWNRRMSEPGSTSRSAASAGRWTCCCRTRGRWRTAPICNGWARSAGPRAPVTGTTGWTSRVAGRRSGR